MPLPCLLNGAKQCQVMTKRAKQRCKNPAAYGCKSCRMHGAHKSMNVLRGIEHPQYKNGNGTKEAKSQRSKRNLNLRYLVDIGNHIELFNKEVKLLGRPPTKYEKLDLNDPKQLKIALIKIIDLK